MHRVTSLASATRIVRIAGIALVTLAAATAVAPSWAVDDATPAVPRAADPLGSARALIAENKWVGAIKELERVNLPRNADWNNLMGYSHRKAKTPDLVAAERFYDAALKIDPKHRGALEYSGELFLQLGDVARAEQRLNTLEKLCGGCDEKKELESALAAFKANGNRYVAKN